MNIKTHILTFSIFLLSTTSCTLQKEEIIEVFNYIEETANDPKLIDQNIFSVVEFGADKTGVINSSESIQRAINALVNKGYGTLYFPKGSYLLNQQVEVTIAGVGMAIKGDGVNETTLKVNNSLGGLKINSANRVSQVTFREFTIRPMLANSGTAIDYNMPAGGNRANRSCLVENVVVSSQDNRSFTYGLSLKGQWRSIIRNATVSGSIFSAEVAPTLKIGIDVSESYTPRVIDSKVTYAEEGVTYNTINGEGGDFCNNHIVKCNTGMQFRSVGVEPHVNVEYNYFDCYKYGLRMESRKLVFICHNTFNNTNTPSGDYNDIFIGMTSGAKQASANTLIDSNNFINGSNPDRKLIYLGYWTTNVFVRNNSIDTRGTLLINSDYIKNTDIQADSNTISDKLDQLIVNL